MASAHSNSARAWFLLAPLLLLASAWLMGQLLLDLQHLRALERDRAELRQARHELFDAGVWSERVGRLLSERLQSAALTGETRAVLTEVVEQVLKTLLVEVERSLSASNGRAGGWFDQLQGVLRQELQARLIDFERLRAQAPRYAESVVERLDDPAVRAMLADELGQLARERLISSDNPDARAAREAVLARHGCSDPAACRLQLAGDIARAARWLPWQLGALLGAMTLLFAAAALAHRGQRLEARAFWVLLGATLLLLIGGLLAPMITVEAGIEALRLQLLGEPLVFRDQLLYHQSKSIAEVAWLLLREAKPELGLVAVLITLFSLVLPSLKLAASVLWRLRPPLRTHPAMRFLVLRSGKWSMADVLVVALFMAYLGFDALVANQLDSLSGAASLQVLTTNGTRLEAGFTLFLAFVFANLALSEFVGGEGASVGSEK
ncbi:MAG: paraquat-inducible protein A [Chromatiaceae bacterium]|nr:paraquat-inducible protein A [Chromatiaceae bacterium]